MIKYAKYIVLLFGLSLLLGSCREESVTTSTETEKDPQELDYPIFTGLVKDIDGGAQAEVVVDVYQGEEKKGSVVTDESGKYSTIDIKLDFGTVISLYPQKEGLVPQLKRRSDFTEVEQVVDFALIPTSEALLIPEPLQNPGSSDLIKLSGYVETPNGEAAEAFISILFDIENQSGGSFSAQGYAGFTDPMGYYEAFLPIDKVLQYTVIQRYCSKDFLNPVDEWLPLPHQLIGPFAEDTQLPTLSNASAISQLNRSLNGEAMCNNSPIVDTEIDIQITNENNTVDIYQTMTDANGFFSLDFQTCSESVDVLIWFDDNTKYQGGGFTQTYIVLDSIEVCQNNVDSTFYTGQFETTLNAGGTSSSLAGTAIGLVTNNVFWYKSSWCDLLISDPYGPGAEVISFEYRQADEQNNIFEADEDDISNIVINGSIDAITIRMVTDVTGSNGDTGNASIALYF